MAFQDSASFLLTQDSLLELTDGSLTSTGAGFFTVTDSRVSVQGGSVSLGGSISFTATNAVVEVEEGSFEWTGSSTAVISASDFKVAGGEARFSGSSNVSWADSTITVSRGDVVTADSTTVSLRDSEVAISGGSFRMGGGAVDILRSDFAIAGGSLNFVGSTVATISEATFNIIGGNMQFADHANVAMADSTVAILTGQLELISNAEALFERVQMSIVGGSAHAKDQVNLHMIDAQLTITSGSFTAQNSADVILENTQVLVDGGDFNLLDVGSFSAHDGAVNVASGNLVVSNPSDARKNVAFVDTDVAVKRSGAQGDVTRQGHMQVVGNVDVTLLGSDFTIDGDLQMFGAAKLHVYSQSSFTIPTGVVTMDQFAAIDVAEDSTFSNQGTLFAPGSIRVPSGNGLTNGGLIETDHALTVNCFDEVLDGSPLINAGTLAFGSGASATAPASCMQHLDHRGLMQISGANVTIATLQTRQASTITLSSSVVQMSADEAFGSHGQVGGSGRVEGSFTNFDGATIMASADDGVTSLDISEKFRNAGAMFFMINSRDLSEPGAFTVVNAGDVALSGGKACICINPDLSFEAGDRFDLLKARQQLDGRFDEVEFACRQCPTRGPRSVASTEATESTCEPTAEYGTVSFSVLIESCDGDKDGNAFDNISPPWYVIVPVTVGIVVVIVVFFGGALLIEERYRKHKFNKRVKSKRSARMKEFTGSNRSAGAYSQADSQSNSSMM